MNFYGYRFDEVMEEKAIIFFVLLSESYKIEAERNIADIVANSAPYMDKDDLNRVVGGYERVVNGIDQEDDDYSGIDKLRQQQNG